MELLTPRRIVAGTVALTVLLTLGWSSARDRLPGRTVLDVRTVLGWDDAAMLLQGQPTSAGGGSGLGVASSGHYKWRRGSSSVSAELAYEDEPLPEGLLTWQEDGRVIRVDAGTAGTHEILTLHESCLVLRLNGTNVAPDAYDVSALRPVLRARLTSAADERCRPTVLHGLR